jgi:hypothetical protein
MPQTDALEPKTNIKPNPIYGQLADANQVQKTIDSLEANGFEAEFVETAEEAKEKLLSLIPHGSTVFTATSQTLVEIGVLDTLNESGLYESYIKVMLDPKASVEEKKSAGYTAQYAVGSVHAVTEDGHALDASKSGSQIPAYVYGAENVIWVVGTHKLVKDVDEGIKRIFEYSLPLENVRAKKAYGIESSVDNILIKYASMPGRIKIILVGQKLGF